VPALSLIAKAVVGTLLSAIPVEFVLWLYHSQRRSLQRHANGACARCGQPLLGKRPGYMEGLRVCQDCARRVNRTNVRGVVVLEMFTGLAALAGLLGLRSDARHGEPVSSWAYLVVVGAAVAFGGCTYAIFAWTRATNRRAAQRDAARIAG
jgi:hypothetical protein